MTYDNPDYRFDVQLQEGIATQAWFYEMTRGAERFEVKHDHQASRTGNVYLETAHDPGRTGTYVASGINTSEADVWIFVLGDPPSAFVGVTIDRLKQLAWDAPEREQPFGSCPTKGRVVSLRSLLGGS